MKKAIIFFVFLLLIQSIQAVNIINVDTFWKAGKTGNIKIQTDVDYEKGQIKIYNKEQELIYEGYMYKETDNFFSFQYGLPTNQMEDEFTVKMTLTKDNYIPYKKTLIIPVKKLTIVDKIWLMLKTNLPFLAF